MKSIARRIPVFFRLPIALVTHAIIAFGPLVAAGYFRGDIPIAIVVILGIGWLIAFERFLLWRLDRFWNLETLQNRTPFPESPDNYKGCDSIKAWLLWVFLGRERNEK